MTQKSCSYTRKMQALSTRWRHTVFQCTWYETPRLFHRVCYLDSFFTTTLEYQDFHIIYLISELVFSKHISQSKHRLIKRIRKCVGDPFFLTWYCMTTIKFVPFFRVGIAQSPALANLLAKKIRNFLSNWTTGPDHLYLQKSA